MRDYAKISPKFWIGATEKVCEQVLVTANGQAHLAMLLGVKGAA